MVLNVLKDQLPQKHTDIFGPLFPRTIGFDDVFSIMDKLFDDNFHVNVPSYPPYNYIKLGDNKWQLEFAIAGFKKDELSVELDKNVLVVRGQKNKEQKDENKQYVFRGFSQRQFKTLFTVHDGVDIEECEFNDGVLTITLVKPEKESHIKKIAIK
jgi:molecular chaperone IbpA